MNLQQSEDIKYLFGKKMRIHPIAVFINVTFLLFGVCCLWFITLNPSINKGGVVMYVGSGIWTGFALWSLPRNIKSYYFFETQYRMDKTIATVFTPKETYSIDLKNPFYLTQCTFRFYITKGEHKDISVYAITPKPLNEIVNDFVGIKPIESIFHNGGIILPLEALFWIQSMTGIDCVSAYPKLMFSPGRKH